MPRTGARAAITATLQSGVAFVKPIMSVVYQRSMASKLVSTISYMRSRMVFVRFVIVLPEQARSLL